MVVEGLGCGDGEIEKSENEFGDDDIETGDDVDTQLGVNVDDNFNVDAWVEFVSACDD